MRISRTLTYGSLVTFIALVVFTTDANASRRPAPPHIVRAGHQAHPPRSGTVQKRAWAVCQVWGYRRCTAALHVAWCESSLRPYARNGQYRGIMQMGSSERARFGHGPGTWAQARAAYRYFLIAGWRPWECRP